MRVRIAGWLLQGLVLLQRDLDDLDAARRRPLREGWPYYFLRLALVTLTVELAIATCTLGRVG